MIPRKNMARKNTYCTHHAHWTADPKNQPPLDNNTQHKKHKTPSPRSPQAAGFQTLQFYRWVQSLYTTRLIMIIAMQQCTIYWWHYFFFYLFNCYSMSSSSARLLSKGEFLKVYHMMFFCHYIEMMCTNNPSYLDVAGELILFWLDFGQGGGCHFHDVFSKVEVGSVVVSVALLLII
jgi:hypothetical protein